jgi:hypothetical protein
LYVTPPIQATKISPVCAEEYTRAIPFSLCLLTDHAIRRALRSKTPHGQVARPP